jgi:hypothetical protein
MRTLFKNRFLVVLLIFLLAIMAANASCVTAQSSLSPSPSATVKTGAPSIKIAVPDNGDTIISSYVEVCVDVKNFQMQDDMNIPNAEGQGHIHFFLDTEPPTSPGASPPANAHDATTFDCYIFGNVAPGKHTISAQLVNNDSTPVQPSTFDSITVTVETPTAAPTSTAFPVSPNPSAAISPFAGSTLTPYSPSVTPTPNFSGPPSVKITIPDNGDTITSNYIEVCTDVENFLVQDAIGKPNVPNQGHLHFYLDTQPQTSPGATPPAGAHVSTTYDCYIFPDVTPGKHTITVELANNNHTPLNPPVYDTITVTVEAPASPTTLSTVNPTSTSTVITSTASP